MFNHIHEYHVDIILKCTALAYLKTPVPGAAIVGEVADAATLAEGDVEVPRVLQVVDLFGAHELAAGDGGAGEECVEY